MRSLGLENFIESWERYLFSVSREVSNVTSSQCSNGAGFSGNQSVTDELSVTLQNLLKPSNGAGCDVVTFHPWLFAGGEEGTALQKELYHEGVLA
jgi:hypothetical protein